MKYLKKEEWRLSLPQRIGIFALLACLIGIEIYLHFKRNVEHPSTYFTDYSKYHALEAELENLLVEAKTSGYTPQSFYQQKTYKSKFNRDSIKPFNPNDLTQQGWEKIGFSPKQAEVIMKYKQMLGGQFQSKEQIRKCFVVSDEIYAVLGPQILLPEKAKSDYKLEKYQTAKKVTYRPFNPNELTQEGWVEIGFSPKQAEVILKYKRLVGGAFKSKEQLKKCIVISDEKYAEMQAYIDLPEVAPLYVKKETDVSSGPESKEVVTKVQPVLPKVEITEKFNPNHLDIEGWVKLGFTEKQAQTILNFKRSLGGKFKDGKTLSKSFVISEEKFKEMEPYLVFD